MATRDNGPVRVLVTCDAIGPADPPDATGGIARGWAARSSGSSSVAVQPLPMSRGGRGFAAAAARLEGAREEPVALADALATIVLLPDGSAVIEAAQVTSRRSSYPVGLLLAATVQRTGVRRVVIGIGDLTCLDGGLGMLQALAGRADDATDVDLGWICDVRSDWRNVPIVAATAESLPLLGFHGAAAHAQEALGLDRRRSQDVEDLLGRYVDRVHRVLPPRRDLLTGKQRKLDREPGAGAGGGVGYGLGLLGAVLQPGPVVSAELADLDASVAASDLIVIGADVFDWTSLQDTVLAHTAQRSAQHGKPVVVLAYEAHLGRRESASLGVSGVYSVVPAGRMAIDVERGEAPQEDAHPRVEALARLATRVAGTWTPS